MSRVIRGMPARFYSWASGRSPWMRDLYREVAEEASSLPAVGRILDIGTGPGRLPLELAKRNPVAEIWGVDISADMVKIAKANVEKEGLSQRIRFRCEDVERMSFPDGYFDLVLSTISLHHWANRVKGLNEIYRVLKDGGEAWIYEIRGDTPSEASRRLRERYGLFTSFILLFIARRHSLTLAQAYEVLHDPMIRFPFKDVQERGVMVKIRLRKVGSLAKTLRATP